jgi:hypothetical protein
MSDLQSKAIRWYGISLELKKLKEEELALRKEIVKAVTSSHEKGTYYKTLDGVELKAHIKENVRLDQEAYWMIRRDLEDWERECVKEKPEPIISKLNHLDPESKLWDIITKSEATPSLDIKFLEE